MDEDLEMRAYQLLIEPASAPPVRGTRPASKMTPNTRFLSHIVHEAKSHNAALLARAATDAHTRLNRLMRSDGMEASEDDRRSSEDGGREKDRRHKRHRSRTDDTKHDEDRHRRRRRHADSDDDYEKRDSGSHGRHVHRHHKSRHRDSTREERVRPQDRRDSSRRNRHSHHDRKREDDENQIEKEAKVDRYPSTSKHRQQSASPGQRHSQRWPASSRPPKQDHQHQHRDCDNIKGRRSFDSTSSSSSDPLDEFVGPRLAPDLHAENSNEGTGIRMRGRGVHSAITSGFSNSMDRHFAAGYDPTNDMEHPLPAPRPQVIPRFAAPGLDTAGREDIDMHEDRKKLLQYNNTKRLREAGFTDKEISILECGGRRRLVQTLWAKKGEARDWDRGKVEGVDGPAKPDWAR
ncbi:hypothetical protein SEPCBS57363_000652 [Sporothrix epigloea]|uniref:Pre-mRNA-splicing factor 38B n=1 Tax=Sporothrix epigloea TaxID=1892477 RepID=A0ABP0D5X6_9PEZI